MCRKYETGDVGAVERLLDELGYRVPAAEIEKRIAAIRNSGGEVFVKELQGRVVGCVNVVLAARLAAGIRGEIASLVVLAGYRGRGIGKELVARAEAWFARRVDAIRIRANAVREPAHRFYRHLGYRETKTQKVFFKKIRPSHKPSPGKEQA